MRRLSRRADGFTLIETLIALAIMSIGLLSLGAVLAFGLARVSVGGDLLTAKEKAAEAVEGAFMARDTGVLTWDQIRNVNSGNAVGVFLEGPQALRTPGPDGIVNTIDDGPVETLVTAGPDGLIDTADDEVVPLSGYTREIEITDVSAYLRELRVTVTYPSNGGSRAFVITTHISAFA